MMREIFMYSYSHNVSSNELQIPHIIPAQIKINNNNNNKQSGLPINRREATFTVNFITP